jgi:hypothetical protein
MVGRPFAQFPCIHVEDVGDGYHEIYYMGPNDGPAARAIGGGWTYDEAVHDLLAQLAVDLPQTLRDAGVVTVSTVPDVEAREGVIQAEAQLVRETPPEDRPLLLDIRQTLPNLDAFYDEIERRRPPDDPKDVEELRREIEKFRQRRR